MVPGFVGLMAFGEWADADNAPVLASVMTVLMVALLAALAAGAVWFGLQARKLGTRAGLVPAILAGLAGAYFLVGFVVQLVTGGSPLGG
jgi:fatty acid desaturase